MANKVHVKKGDTVIVLTGKQGLKQSKSPVKGKVLNVIPDKGMVLVEGVNMSTKHKKPKSRYQQGGIIHQESPIDSSNVMLVCDKCGKPTKIGKRVLDNGLKSRVCKKCGQDIDFVNEVKEGK